MSKLKMTKLIPFSNSSDYMDWMSRNCDTCTDYENESTDRNKAKCKLSFDIEFSSVIGEIPISTLEFFGFTPNYNLADCAALHCNKDKTFSDYKKVRDKASKANEGELPFEY